MKFTNDRPVHIYGDSHTAGYEIDHDEILGRNCFKEKKDLIVQFGLHQAIYYWNQKMGRATNMSVFEFAHRQLPNAWAPLFDPNARIVTWPAMSNDYLHLQIKFDYYKNKLKSYEHVYLPILRPTRTFKLDNDGRYDFSNEDLDGNSGACSDCHYATVWAIEISAVMDFLDQKKISYSFIQNFDIFDETASEDIHVISLNSTMKYHDFFYEIHNKVLDLAPSWSLANFGKLNGFWHNNAEGHKQFAAYLKKHLT